MGRALRSTQFWSSGFGARGLSAYIGHKCLLVYYCVCMDTVVGVLICVYGWGQHQRHFSDVSTLSFQVGSFIWNIFAKWARLASIRAPGICLSLPPGPGLRTLEIEFRPGSSRLCCTFPDSHWKTTFLVPPLGTFPGLPSPCWQGLFQLYFMHSRGIVGERRQEGKRGEKEALSLLSIAFQTILLVVRYQHYLTSFDLSKQNSFS